jgi:hypothetical protein
MLEIAWGAELFRDIGHHRLNQQARKIPAQTSGGLLQETGADIDRHVESRHSCRSHCGENNPALLRTPGTELDQSAGAQVWNQVRHPRLQQRALGSGRVILRQPGDFLEQLRAPVIVEVFRGELLLWCRKTRRHLRQHPGIRVAQGGNATGPLLD